MSEWWAAIHSPHAFMPDASSFLRLPSSIAMNSTTLGEVFVPIKTAK